MRYSKIYIPTVKDVMQETEALNYRLLHKAGYIRKNSAGLFSFLPLGRKVLLNLIGLIGCRLEHSGCFELHLPASVTEEDFYRNIMSARPSFKELPIGGWYIKEYIQESIRPRMGLLQPKAWEAMEGFKLLDGMDSLSNEHQSMVELLVSLLTDLNIDFLEAQQLSADCIGESDTVFILPDEKGEDTAVKCSNCGIIKTIDSLKCTAKTQDEEIPKELKLEFTPQVKTIADVADYLGVEAASIVKTLIYNADGKLYGILLRGDRELSEVKLKEVLKCQSLRPANEKEVFEATGAEVGFAGPIGLKTEIICDFEAAAVRNIIVGANKTNHHYVNAVIGRDFNATVIVDLRCCAADDKCPECGGDIVAIKGFDLGNVRKHGTQYAEKHGLAFVNSQGSSSGINIMEFKVHIYRLLAALAEKNNDEAGLILPKPVAPFEIIVMAVHFDNEAQKAAAEQIYNTLEAMGYNVLLDDREDRISVKFKDSELIGIPLRITIGRKISEGIVEVKFREAAMQEMQLDVLIEHIAGNEL